MKKWMCSWLTGILLFFASGCCLPPTGGTDSAAILYTVKDARGKMISFTQKPQHIVCCQVFADEILLDLVAHDRIAALSRWVHDDGLSSAVDEAADVKEIVEANTESILRVQPDLVIVGSNNLPLAEALEDTGTKVYVLKNISQLNEIDGNIASLAQAVGEEAQGAKLRTELAADLQKIRQDPDLQLPPVRTLLFLRFGAIGGEGTIYHDVLVALGLQDAYAEVRGYSSVIGSGMILSKEEVIRCNPELLLMASWTQGGAYQDSDSQRRELYSDPAYVNVDAVRNHQSCIIPQRYINCLSHHAGKNLIQLAEILRIQLQEQIK